METNSFSKKQWDFIQNLDTHLDFCEGTIRSGKTYSGVFKFFLKIRQSKDVSGINVMSAYDIRTFERVVLPIIRDQFPDAVYRPQGEGGNRVIWKGETIFIVGFSDISRFKRILGSSIKNFFMTEANLLTNIYFMNEIIGRSSSVDNPYLYFDCNPDDPDLQIYEVLNRCKLMTDSPNREYFNTEVDTPKWHSYHFVFEDNPIMTEEKVHRLKESIPVDSPYYAPKILGVRTKSEGFVFAEAFKPHHIQSPEALKNKTYTITTVGVDTSYSEKTKDVIAFIYAGFTKDGEFVVLDEWVHNNSDFVMRASDIPKHLKTFIDKNNQLWGVKTYGAYIDSADANLINEINLAQNGIGAQPSWKKFKIIDRIQWTLDALHKNAYFINSKCITHIDEMNNYVWNDKKNLTPMDKNDHTLNASQYAWIPYKHLLRNS